MTATGQNPPEPAGGRLPAGPFWLLALQFLVIPLSVVELGRYAIAPFLGLGALAFLAHRALRDEPYWIRLFLFAAFYGTVGEAVCVYGSWTASGEGLWIYRFPSLPGFDWRLPAWIPLVWGNLFVLFVSIAARIAEGFDHVRSSSVREGIRYLLTLLIVAYAGVLYRRVDPRILLFFTPFFVAFLLHWARIPDLTIFIVAASIGSFGEIYAMKSGYWFYTKPMLRSEWLANAGVPGVPVSLAMAWGLSAVFLHNMARRKTRWRAS